MRQDPGRSARRGRRNRRGPSPGTRAGEEGFLLPFALLALTLLSMLAAAGHLLSLIEYRISHSHRASVEAFYAADGALEAGLAGARRGEGESASAGASAGPAAVRLSWEPLLRLPDGGTLLEATATARMDSAHGGPVRRTIHAVVLLPPAYRPPAALVALGDIASGAEGAVSGIDAAPPGACPAAPATPVAGLLLPDEGTGDGPESGDLVLEGAPALIARAPRDFARAAGLQWPVPSGGTGAGPSDTPRDVPGGDGSGATWPVKRLSGEAASLTAAESGRGTVLAAGDLTLEAGFRWQGLLLVGGSLLAEGPVRIEGAAAAGLDVLRRGTAPATLLSGPGTEIRYHSCHLAAAVAALPSSPVTVPRSWGERP